MRRLTLTALLLALPALAQEATEPPATPPPAQAPAQAEPAAPAPSEQAPATETPSPDAPAEAPTSRKKRQKPAPKPAAKATRPEAPKPESPPALPAAAAPEPAKPAEEPPAPPPSREPAVPGKVSARERVADEARVFFSLLLSGDVRALAFRLDFPFQLESRRFDTSEALVSEWVKALRQRRTDLVTLYDIEVFTPEEMERKYGAPPKRLGTLDYRAPNTFVTVANLSGHAAVAVFRLSGGEVKAVAYTD
ncbi:hypothetical protein FGE12_16560 [Aggregicoccus sp. 17bor-14]|uniref:hypothetical protein n=1 Tax=Myxococcaceae TaxID=31 RepID=UPI00129CBDAD|nr:MULTISPECIES: hypothetical protein [Myxococcaceae]MBF5044012.1 hypothetical protein [Simulacricoccus sp. 17bor-14]MRI89763.1 hypothetical protein [Aggregicoccus sp. 17bor-14]